MCVFEMELVCCGDGVSVLVLESLCFGVGAVVDVWYSLSWL